MLTMQYRSSTGQYTQVSPRCLWGVSGNRLFIPAPLLGGALTLFAQGHGAEAAANVACCFGLYDGSVVSRICHRAHESF